MERTGKDNFRALLCLLRAPGMLYNFCSSADKYLVMISTSYQGLATPVAFLKHFPCPARRDVSISKLYIF